MTSKTLIAATIGGALALTGCGGAKQVQLGGQSEAPSAAVRISPAQA
jgi:hypothetical protein